jgi:hypothetical protein
MTPTETSVIEQIAMRECKVNGEELRAELARRKITGVEFGRASGMPQRTVSYILNDGTSGWNSLHRTVRGLIRLGIPTEKIIVPVEAES